MANLYRVNTVISSVSGGPYFSTLYFQQLPLMSASSAVSHVRNFWNSYKSYAADSMTFQVQADVPVIEVETGAILEVQTVDTPDVVEGTDNGQILPFATQGIGRLTTGQYVAGRQLRGRIFLPGVTENNSDGGIPGSGYQSAVGDALTALATSSISVTPVVYSRTHHVAAPITGATLWNQWGVLRSRRD